MKATLLAIIAALPLVAQERYSIEVKSPSTTLHVSAGALEEAEAAVARSRSKIAAQQAAFYQRVLDKFDADKDGKLNDEEQAAWKAAQKKAWNAYLLEKYDANKDGVIDAQEETVMRDDMKPKEAPTSPESTISICVKAPTPEASKVLLDLAVREALSPASPTQAAE